MSEQVTAEQITTYSVTVPDLAGVIAYLTEHQETLAAKHPSMSINSYTDDEGVWQYLIDITFTEEVEPSL